jgi:hypothetical protein
VVAQEVDRHTQMQTMPGVEDSLALAAQFASGDLYAVQIQAASLRWIRNQLGQVRIERGKAFIESCKRAGVEPYAYLRRNLLELGLRFVDAADELQVLHVEG